MLHVCSQTLIGQGLMQDTNVASHTLVWWTCGCTHTHTHTQTHTRTHKHIHTYTHTHKHTHTYTHKHTHIHIHIHTQTHTHTQTNTQTYTRQLRFTLRPAMIKPLLTPFLLFILLPVHHQSTNIATRPQHVLPVQMTDGRVSV